MDAELRPESQRLRGTNRAYTGRLDMRSAGRVWVSSPVGSRRGLRCVALCQERGSFAALASLRMTTELLAKYGRGHSARDEPAVPSTPERIIVRYGQRGAQADALPERRRGQCCAMMRVTRASEPGGAHADLRVSPQPQVRASVREEERSLNAERTVRITVQRSRA